jgi:hypothetical protein
MPRFHLVAVIVFFAVIHFCLLLLAMANGFIIFRGPSTPWEIFWYDAMEVLLFPLDLFPWGALDAWGQTFMYGLNSLLWGTGLAFLFLRVQKSRTKKALL